ncbi:MAG: tRNA lysidine(34) synthetase TilS [Alphaproteobacteria bacterium]|nr:tRNA lysidine(34) synthetase TilS [Alphaproteobacteria bacterium]
MKKEKMPVVNKVAVAVSGGADSMALMHLANRYCKKHNIELIVLTVNHGLRESASKEVLFVENEAKKLGLETRILTWNGDKPKTGIEQSARINRYKLLFKECEKSDIPVLLVGHHAQDQAETYIIRESSHSGELGLAGMSMVKHFGKNRLLFRPLMNLLPESLKAFNRKHNIPWVEDESNKTDQFERGRLRQHLTKEDIIYAFNKSVDYGKKREIWQAKLAKFYSDYVRLNNYNYAIIHIDALNDELLKDAICQIVRLIGNKSYLPDENSVKSIVEKMKEPKFRGATIGGCVIDFGKKGNIYVYRELSNMSPEVKIDGAGEYEYENFVFKIRDENFKGIIKPVGLGNQDDDVLKSAKRAFYRTNYSNKIFNTIPGIFDSLNDFICFIPFLEYKGKKMNIEGMFYTDYPLETVWKAPHKFM